MTSLEIEGINIGKKFKPLIIAEMSGNHNQSLERALSLVDAAAEAGADAIKLQTYTADTMTLDLNNNDFCIDDPDSLWRGQYLYGLYQKAYTPWDWHQPIMERASEKGIFCFSTPFDLTAVDFLETLNVSCYKIASFECIDLPLIKKVARTGKPIIISTGMASIAEITEAVELARIEGCKELVLLKCTSTYPASPANTNLKTIEHMRELFKCEVGLSDHTLGIGVAVAGVALGATVIEKHLTLSREDGGVDSAFSLEPAEFSKLVEETKHAWEAIGEISYGPVSSENKSRMQRRSLYITEDLQPGDVLTLLNLRSIRPGFGLSPKYYDVLVGRKVVCNIKRGTPMSWDLVMECE